MNEELTLSICVVARNEERYLPALLEDIRRQEYPHGLTEVVLIDSMSTDGTRRIMEDFRENKGDFSRVTVASNEKGTQASGWNRAITLSQGDVIARIDAHSALTPSYSRLVMAHIAEGENVVGGQRPCRMEKDTPWSRVLLQTENSLFGSSIAKSRRAGEKTYVNSMFHAAYRREVFDKAGLFDERLLRTEDNEMHYRIRKANYRLLFDPQIVSYQYARSSFSKMVRQKYGNGCWIGKTLFVCPGCISLYHLVPAAFVIGIVLTGLLAAFGFALPALLMWGLYLLFALANTVFSAAKSGFYPQTLLMPFLFLILHVAYGAGTFVGLLGRRV